jgi:predicted DNA-binding transcriptional regulator AlpA
LNAGDIKIPFGVNRSSELMGREQIEVINSAELAQRLKVKESWIVDQSKRSRTSDPIPVFRLGKHRRYRWGAPEMDAWLERRAGNNTQQRKAGSSKNGGTIE